MSVSRRSFIAGAGATLLAAPAIVRACNIMPVRNRIVTWGPEVSVYYDRIHAALDEASQHHLFEEPVWVECDLSIRNGVVHIVNVTAPGGGYCESPTVVVL